ncbi:PglZ domain-containing protein [Desulfococcaceae bacterium HSG8]|nr:PglZ domain-containing protein [Desulfococcaceae bacterium HSG8]
MDWRNALLIKYNLGSQAKKIIADETGILSSPDFKTFLFQKGIASGHASTLRQLLSQLNDDSRLIISSFSDIPSYLHRRADIYLFKYDDLPFNIGPNLFSQLKLHEIITLCNYLSACDPHQLVTQYNLRELLNLAQNRNQQNEIEILTKQIDLILSKNADYNKIIEIGTLWGKLIYTSYRLKQERPEKTEKIIDQYVLDYVLSGELRNIWYSGPGDIKSVDRIIPYLKNKNIEKFALICFDGLGVAEWQLLKEHLKPNRFDYHEKYIYALIPTTTIISRSALFSGSCDRVYQAKSVNEIKEFRKNFPDHDHKHFRRKDPVSSDGLLGITAVTMLFNFFDELSHSTRFPPDIDSKALYFDSVTNYLSNMKLGDTLNLLLNEGYRLFICSDHGSAVATGNGKNIDKWLHDKFARRGCIVDESSLLEFYDYPQYKVPFVKGKVVVFPENRTMFDTAGKLAITHGGITVDELILPFAEITKS